MVVVGDSQAIVVVDGVVEVKRQDAEDEGRRRRRQECCVEEVVVDHQHDWAVAVGLDGLRQKETRKGSF